MIKLKILAVLRLLGLLFNGLVLGTYSIIWDNHMVDNLAISQKPIRVKKKKLTKRELKDYLNECYKQ